MKRQILKKTCTVGQRWHVKPESRDAPESGSCISIFISIKNILQMFVCGWFPGTTNDAHVSARLRVTIQFLSTLCGFREAFHRLSVEHTYWCNVSSTTVFFSSQILHEWLLNDWFWFVHRQNSQQAVRWIAPYNFLPFTLSQNTYVRTAEDKPSGCNKRRAEVEL